MASLCFLTNTQQPKVYPWNANASLLYMDTLTWCITTVKVPLVLQKAAKDTLIFTLIGLYRLFCQRKDVKVSAENWSNMRRKKHDGWYLNNTETPHRASAATDTSLTLEQWHPQILSPAIIAWYVPTRHNQGKIWKCQTPLFFVAKK